MRRALDLDNGTELGVGMHYHHRIAVPADEPATELMRCHRSRAGAHERIYDADFILLTKRAAEYSNDWSHNCRRKLLRSHVCGFLADFGCHAFDFGHGRRWNRCPGVPQRVHQFGHAGLISQEVRRDWWVLVSLVEAYEGKDVVGHLVLVVERKPLIAGRSNNNR